MKLFTLHPSICKLKYYISPEEKLSEQAKKLKLQLKQWEELKVHKVPEAKISEIVGISRAKYYRYKKAMKLYGLKGIERRSKRPKRFRSSQIPQSTIDTIYRIRKENPTYGKAKVVVILKRDYNITISESSVGRVLKALIIKGKVQRSSSAIRVKRRRKFKGHAQVWSYGIAIKDPGQMIQIDHMTVSKNGISCKHFQAWDKISKFIIAEVYSNANSSTAKRFLHQVIAQLPFKIQSIQVDGGSEFMKDFESECQKLNIPLYVLPPKRPQYNGGVERGNRTFREEFYQRPDLLADSVGAMKAALKHAVHKYNSFRPHNALNGLTPLQYTNSILRPIPQSHML